MPTRPNVYAPADLAPLRDALLSGEERYVEAAMTALQESDSDAPPEELAEEEAEWRPLFRAVVFGEEAEGGVSAGGLEYLAKGLGLIEGRSLMDEWKLRAWFDYETLVADSIDPEAKALLHRLCAGRPFPEERGRLVGTFYAWLDGAEAHALKTALAAVDGAALGDDLDEFHEELLQALDAADRGLLLFGW